MSESSYPNLSEKSALNALVRFQNVKIQNARSQPCQIIFENFHQLSRFFKS